MKYTATCLFGLEKFVGEEIDALGYKRIETIDGRVTFEGDSSTTARFNINSRYAERLYVNVGSFKAVTFDQLFEGVKALCWEEFIGKQDAFPVKGHSIKSALFSIPDCQRIIKKAVADRLMASHKTRFLPEVGVKYQIEFFILNNNVTMMIDTSGTALHKRGYRPQTFEAPIRETLAAAMVKLARPREDVLFWDPFCGSGTIPIEAAMLMTHTAPGLKRGFAGENFAFLPKESWKSAREEAISAVCDTGFECYASDIDENAVRLAEENIKHAGMGKYIKTFRADALQIKTEGRRGTIVCNPPYGERMLSREGAEQLYRKMGRHFATLGSWQIYIITSEPEFEKYYGRRADKVRKLYNGMLKCGYYQYFKRK